MTWQAQAAEMARLRMSREGAGSNAGAGIQQGTSGLAHDWCRERAATINDWLACRKGFLCSIESGAH